MLAPQDVVGSKVGPNTFAEGELAALLRVPGLGDRYFERTGHSYQVGKRSSAHLLHDLAAMNLDRDFADA
jgi:hypothetical protein